MSTLFDKLKDEELDLLLKYQNGEQLDDATLNSLSDDALDVMLDIKTQTKKETADSGTVQQTPGSDGLDHTLPEGFGTPEYQEKAKQEAEENRGTFWGGVKKGFGDTVSVAGKVLDDAVNLVSPVEIEISDRPDTIRKSINRAMDNVGEEDDVGFDVYKQIGTLSKTASGLHDIGVGEANKEDIDSYNENLSRLMVDKLGYKDLLFDDESGKYYVETQEGEHKQLNQNTIKTIAAEVMGDKAEILAAMYGAKKGYDAGKTLGWKGKVGGAIIGGASGAALGNIVDQFAGAIETGEKLTMQQRLDEIGKSAVLDATGAVVGGAVIKVAGTALKVPATVSKKIYSHMVNGNIDGAKKLLKSDLGIDDAYIDDALEQMQKSQREVYSSERNALNDAIDIANTGDVKGALKELGDGALDTLGDAQKKEEFLAAAMKHPQGEKMLKEALGANPKGALELEKSINSRAKQVTESLEGLSGTEAKEAVERYEGRVHNQYGEMRDTFSDAFKETGYRFDLDSLKLDSTLDDLEKRVTDPYVKDKFKAMTGAVENIVDGSKSGIGVERDVDALLDIRQMMNKFYRQNKKAFDLRPDKQKFFEMVKSIDTEIERAMDTHLTPEIKKEMLQYFDKARADYKAMYDIQESGLYRSLMSEGKSAEERVSALLKNAKGDNNELQQMLGKLDVEEAAKVEDTLVQSIIKKHTKGVESQMQSIDYAKALDDMQELKPFLKSEGSRQSIELVEDIYSKFRHDFDLAKAVKSAGESVDAGGIGSSVKGRLEVAATSRIFRYVMTLIPWGETPKRLALYRHIGSALKKSRTPVEMAKHLRGSSTLPLQSKQHLKELIKVHNAALKADSEVKAQKVAKQLKEVEEQIAEDHTQKARELKEFKAPNISELRAVQHLSGDDASATLARSIRSIQEGNPNKADIKRYLDAKKQIEPERLGKMIEKEREHNFSAKYRNVGDEEIAKISRLRDYLMSDESLQYGNEFNPQQVKALMYDLRTKGKPRSTKYDRLYDDLMEMHKELESRIDKAYGKASVESQTRVPTSSEDAASLVTRHQGHQAERLPSSGDPSGTRGFGSQSTQTYDSIAKANEKLKDSAVREANGDLKVLYHGTTHDFDTFSLKKTSNGNFGHGFYLAEDVGQVNKHYTKGEGANVMPVVVNIEQPFDIMNLDEAMTVYKEYANTMGKPLPKADKPFRLYKLMTNGNKGKEEFRNFLAYKGYDGITGVTPGAGRQYVAFYPNQIKSVNNQGIFDLADANILHAKGMDHLVAGGVAGVEQDEDGNISLDPQKFILGLGGYTIAKAALKNPKVQAEVKDAIEKSLKEYEGSLFDTRANLFGGETAIGFDDAVKFSDTTDKKTKFWVDDSAAKLSNDLFSEDGIKKIIKAKKEALRLEEVLDHPKLYKAYPELKEYNIFIDDLGNKHGVHDALSDAITLDSKLLYKVIDGDKEALSTLIHEVQHAIQKKEGFARGASIEEYKIPNFSGRVRHTLQKIDSTDKEILEFETMNGSTTEEILGLPEELQGEYMDMIESRIRHQEKLNRLEPGLDPRSSYLRTAGEQEARAVQAKLLYPDLEPYEALKKLEGDIGEPIVKFDDSVSDSRAYHASSMEIGELSDDKILWTANNSEYAKKHASSNTGKVYEVNLDGLKMLDGYSDEGKAILAEANNRAEHPMSTLLNDDGGVTSFAVQNKEVISYLKSLGYDAVRTSDSARGAAPVIGVISPKKIKGLKEV